MTFREALNWGISQLGEAGIEEKDIDAWCLFEYVTKMTRTKFFMESMDTISDSLFVKYQECISKRKQHYPVQYITNEQQFMGYNFYVDESVLVPRSETEELVIYTEQLVGESELKMPKVLDMCTGSGCIAVSLKLRNNNFNITAVDISADALFIACKNADKLNAEINCVQSDLFSELSEENKFDVIVSNPPYIETREIDALMDEVRKYEPVIALDGYEDGLYFYRKIIEESLSYLNPGGVLVFEIGYNQGQSVSKLMIENGFSKVKVKKDLAGLDRIVSGGI